MQEHFDLGKSPENQDDSGDDWRKWLQPLSATYTPARCGKHDGNGFSFLLKNRQARVDDAKAKKPRPPEKPMNMKIRRKKAKPITPEIVAEVRRLQLEGWTTRKIAQKCRIGSTSAFRIMTGWEPDPHRKRGAPKGNKNAVGRRNPERAHG